MNTTTSGSSGEICLRSYPLPDGLLVAACDRELVGRTLVEGELQMVIDDAFYGEPASLAELRALLPRATSANLTGSRVVQVARELGLVEATIQIEGVEHAQFFPVP